MIDAVAGAASRRVITNKNGRDGGQRRLVPVFVKQRTLAEVQTHGADDSRAFT